MLPQWKNPSYIIQILITLCSLNNLWESCSKTILRAFVPYTMEIRLISFKTQNLSYLAGLQNLKHQRQALCDELLSVLLLLDGFELLEQALDEGPAVLLEGRAQGLQPRVQSPGNTCTQSTQLIPSPREALPLLLLHLCWCWDFKQKLPNHSRNQIPIYP